MAMLNNQRVILEMPDPKNGIPWVYSVIQCPPTHGLHKFSRQTPAPPTTRSGILEEMATSCDVKSWAIEWIALRTTPEKHPHTQTHFSTWRCGTQESQQAKRILKPTRVYPI